MNLEKVHIPSSYYLSIGTIFPQNYKKNVNILRVILEVIFVSLLDHFKNYMTFKITIWLKFNSDNNKPNSNFKSHIFLRGIQ
jgi:hypothetical protein